LPASAGAQNKQRQVASSPTVSPYMNLLNNNSDVTNYQSLVRPMVNQNRVNAQERVQLNRTQSKPATLRYSKSESLRSTGHQASYQTYGHYYPTLNRQY
jgi:hypothetical protein